MRIDRDRSIIPSLDFTSLDDLDRVVGETADLPAIGGYKLGFRLSYRHGIPRVIERIRKLTGKPVIFDHQKAATDIPDLGKAFAEDLAGAGVDAVILFPMAGPVTQEAWTKAAAEAGLGVIVGGEMTHPGFSAREGGYLAEGASERIYLAAASQGVRDFVVPGNRPDRIARYRRLIEEAGVTPVFYSPGLVAQGGKIPESALAAGPRWHAIVGRGIAEAPDIPAAVEDLARGLA